jgi:hypothetical protein
MHLCVNTHTLGLWIGNESLETVDKICAVERIA